MKLGDRVWIRDDNSRHYEPGRFGPVYRKTFKVRTIVGETETRLFWILDGEGYMVSKKTGSLRCPNADGSWYGLQPRVWTSEREVDLDIWAHDYRPEVVRAVQWCRSPETLRKIADLLIAEGQLAAKDVNGFET